METRISLRKLIFTGMLMGSVLGKAQNVTLDFAQAKLKDVLSSIESQTGYVPVFSEQLLDVERTVSIQVKDMPLEKALERLVSGTTVIAEVKNGKIYFVKKTQHAGQEASLKTLAGSVKDINGEIIIGANILVKGTTNGTITDIDGNFSLSEVPENATLVISYIGYTTQELAVKNAKSFHIRLKEDSETLEEVVVTALGIKREEKALGYAVQKVSGSTLNTVKTVDVATSLTGKIAGLNIQNSTEFNSASSLLLRGETPLLVVDGVPYKNLTLRDIAPDDIESVDVLKGATASALYGARGGSGAVMVTTKRGQKEGLNISVNSSTMFNAGYLRKPEVQTSYSSGTGGKYRVGDYVWGDKMDIGREARQYNPYTHEWEMQPLVSKGKNNLQNFQELSLITNNNVSITQKGKYGSIRTSLTHVYNKGQWPNEKLNKLTYTVSGDMKWNKFSADAGITYNKRFYPNMGGTGYGGSGYLYNLLIWSGTEFDIRDYKNYWLEEDMQSNWMDRTYYENPYFIANEIISSGDYDMVNAFVNVSYQMSSWLKAVLRSGLDVGFEKKEYKTPVGSTAGWGEKKGYYGIERNNNFSINNDFLLMAEKKWGDFNVDGFLGGTIYYLRDDAVAANTQGGLSIPGYYSLKASVDPAYIDKTYATKQVNSIYGKFSLSWKSLLFLDVTGRNDWSSTLPKETRSYFYPSVAGSVVMSEFIKLPSFIDFWKVRGSWTVTKKDMDIFAINNVYTINTNVWDNMTGAYGSSELKNSTISPATSRSYEFGTALYFLNNRLRADITYYNKLYYNNSILAKISPASGYTSTLVNIDEEQVRRGWELTIAGDIIKNKNLNWSATLNWSRDRYCYAKIDPVYSKQKPWVEKGERVEENALIAVDYQRDLLGNIIHGNDGLPLLNPTATLQGYTSPDWTWGLSTSLSYKNITVDISFDGSVGGLAHSMIDQAMWNSGAHINSDNQYRFDEVVNGRKTYIGQGVKVISGSADWDSDGNIIRDDRVFAPNDQVVSYETYVLRMNPWAGEVRTQNILDKTFIKLRNLSVSYSLPEEWCNKIKLKGASLGVVGQNIWMWTKDFKYSDPDVGSENINSPSIRYVGFNVKVNL